MIQKNSRDKSRARDDNTLDEHSKKLRKLLPPAVDDEEENLLFSALSALRSFMKKTSICRGSTSN